MGGHSKLKLKKSKEDKQLFIFEKRSLVTYNQAWDLVFFRKTQEYQAKHKTSVQIAYLKTLQEYNPHEGGKELIEPIKRKDGKWEIKAN